MTWDYDIEQNADHVWDWYNKQLVGVAEMPWGDEVLVLEKVLVDVVLSMLRELDEVGVRHGTI